MQQRVLTDWPFVHLIWLTENKTVEKHQQNSVSDLTYCANIQRVVVPKGWTDKEGQTVRLSQSSWLPRHLSANEHLLSTSDAEIGELGTAKSCREFKVKIKEVWGRRGWSCSCCLQCWHPVGAPVHVPVASLPIQLPANSLGIAAENGSRSWAPCHPHMEDLEDSPGLDLPMVII